jgi:hypothetical protein
VNAADTAADGSPEGIGHDSGVRAAGIQPMHVDDAAETLGLVPDRSETAGG